MKTTILVTLAAMGLAQSASAVEVIGGTAEIGYSTFTSDSSLSRTIAAGGIEVGFSRAFSMQLDLAMYGLNTISRTGRNVTLHSNFHINDSGSVGLFLGSEDISGPNASYYGIEGGFELPEADIEMYLSREDDGASDVNQFGISVSHDFGNDLGISGKYDRASFNGGADLTRFSVGMDYNLSPTSKLYGEVGTLSASAVGLSGSETFIGIGARINFGGGRGVTFNRRGLLDIIPGL